MTLRGTNFELSRLASAQGAGPASNAPESPGHKKLRKAAQEFEGILISQLFGEFQSSLSSLPGETPLAGSEGLNSLAIQTLSSALAKQGGLGIAKMVVHQLEPTLDRGQ